MRSIRQDISVQNIENQFTVNVYEINASISIENYDLHTYEQCQTQLIRLYDNGINSKNQCEFNCYMILYHALKGNDDQIISIYNTLSLDEQNDLVYFARNMCTYIVTKNYYKIFRCYYLGSNKMAKMIKPFLSQLRKNFLQEQANGIIGEGRMQYLADIGWDGDINECQQFLKCEMKM